MKTYAGIGSRDTPQAVMNIMTAYARGAAQAGWRLRSGSARGADTAFEIGAAQVQGSMEIFTARDEISDEAFLLASMHHPAWDKCDEYARRLHARNGYIILGRDLDDPVDFVLCWTPGGALKGGTAQALRIAAAWDIPVYNLGDPATFEAFEQFVLRHV